MNGIVRSYNDAKGYGFIQPLIGKPDEVQNVYFHISGVARKGRERPTVVRGAEVSFDVVRGDRGPQAANVQLRTVKL